MASSGYAPRHYRTLNSLLRGRELVRAMKGNEAMLQIIKSARRLSLSAAWAAAIVVACATGLLPGKAHAQTKIVEGFVSHGALQWPEYIASEFGWFKDNGKDLDMLVVGASAAEQVAGGGLNLGYSGFPDFIRAINQGAPVKIVINAITAPPYGVYSKPTIKKIADLKGKTVSIGGTKDVTLIYMEAFIGSAG